MSNYYTVAHKKKVRDLVKYIDLGIPDLPDMSSRGILPVARQCVALFDGYVLLIDPPSARPGTAGWHSHSPKEVALIVADRELGGIVKTLCHELSHCIQSKATWMENQVRHCGEAAGRFDDYYLYELRADRLAYEVYLKNFVDRDGYTSWPRLVLDNFKTYHRPVNVLRLYRKWRKKCLRYS